MLRAWAALLAVATTFAIVSCVLVLFSERSRTAYGFRNDVEEQLDSRRARPANSDSLLPVPSFYSSRRGIPVQHWFVEDRHNEM